MSRIIAAEGGWPVRREYDAITGQRTRTWTGTDSGDPGSDTRYTYDVLGRMISVDSVARHGTAVTEDPTQYYYDLVGNLDLVIQSNGVLTDYVYDTLGRVDLLQHFIDDNDNLVFDAETDDELLAEFDYDLAADGRRDGVTETDDQGHVTTIAWEYDGLSRLISETFTGYDAEGTALSYKDEYTFDLVGNRLTKTHDHGNDTEMDDALDNLTEYVYDINDRLLTETRDAAPAGAVTDGDTFTLYEWGPNADPLNGEGGDSTEQTLKTIYEGLDSIGDIVETAEYLYNLQGRLAEAHIERTVEEVTTEIDTAYEYNAEGIRVKQTVTQDGTTTETTYLIDPFNSTGYAQILEEVLHNPATMAVIKEVAYVLGMDVISQSTLESAVTTALQMLYDAHGSTRAVLTALQAVVERYSYDAYGDNLAGMLASTLTELLYSGEVFDPAIGMQYLRARYYDAATGLFQRLDTFAGDILNPTSLHKYLYTLADPVNGIDPSGMFTLKELMIVAAVVVLVIATIIVINHFITAAADWPLHQMDLKLASALSMTNGSFTNNDDYYNALVHTVANVYAVQGLGHDPTQSLATFQSRENSNDPDARYMDMWNNEIGNWIARQNNVDRVELLMEVNLRRWNTTTKRWENFQLKKMLTENEKKVLREYLPQLFYSDQTPNRNAVTPALLKSQPLDPAWLPPAGTPGPK